MILPPPCMGWERKKPPYNWHRTSGFPMRTGNRRERQKSPSPGRNPPEEQFQEAKNRCFCILADYLHLLRAWRTDYAPHSPEEAFHPRFVEALQKQAQVEYLLDVLLFGETEEKSGFDYGTTERM